MVVSMSKITIKIIIMSVINRLLVGNRAENKLV